MKRDIEIDDDTESNFLGEIGEEIVDFFEDIIEGLFSIYPHTSRKNRTLLVNGVLKKVRPAYVFAERLENILKLMFGYSIFVSAFVSSFWGFSGLSGLLTVLITSIAGRVCMMIIGISYMLLATWKLLHIKRP